MYASDYIDSYFDESDIQDPSKDSVEMMVLPSLSEEDARIPRLFDCDG